MRDATSECHVQVTLTPHDLRSSRNMFDSEAKILFDSSEPPGISLYLHDFIIQNSCHAWLQTFYKHLLVELDVAMISLGTVHSYLCCARSTVSIPRVFAVFRAKTVCGPKNGGVTGIWYHCTPSTTSLVNWYPMV